MTNKSDKLKKKMAMIAREREEFELQKLAMKGDLDYSMGKKDREKDNSSAGSRQSSSSSISRQGSNSSIGRQGSINSSDIRRYLSADEGDNACASAPSSAKLRPRVSHGSGKIGGDDSSVMTRPFPVPSGKKISDWCYTSSPESTPPVLKGGQDLYVDVRFLGRGAFGTVDLVKNKEDNRLYAVKTLLVRDKDDQAEFLREVQFLRKRHPFVVHLHDVFVTTSPHRKVYLVMHYCEGGDLGKVISSALKGKNHIPETQIIKWFCQISLAVNYLHDLRIVHRDIKPQNILLSDSGEVAQLADFGLATQLSGEEESFECCEVGTPYYTAPEMIKAQPYSCPVDAWSLGVVLFELLTLELPFTGDDTASLVRSVLEEGYNTELISPLLYSPEVRGVALALHNDWMLSVKIHFKLVGWEVVWGLSPFVPRSLVQLNHRGSAAGRGYGRVSVVGAFSSGGQSQRGQGGGRGGGGVHPEGV